MPHSLLVDVLGPLLEFVGYLLIILFAIAGLFNEDFSLALLAFFFVFGIFFSVCALIFEEMEFRRCPRARDLALLDLIAVVENFGYRQLNGLWRIEGWWQFLRGKKHWGTMPRRGSDST